MAVEQSKTEGEQGLFSWIQINLHYFRTFPGILKIIELIIGVICLFLALPAVHNTTQWFSYTTLICFVVTIIWSFIYLLTAREAVSFPINWPLTEMLNTCFLALIILVASIFQISHWAGAHNVHGRWSNIFAGIFGVGNFFIYSISSCSSYVDWRQLPDDNP